MPRKTKPVIQRLLDKRVIDNNTNCWLYTGARNEAGYGIIGLGGRHLGTDRVHRVSYRYYKGEIGSYLVLHKRECPNRHCFNPDHLYRGTDGDNRLDALINGTAIPPPTGSGENNNFSKLTEIQVREIKALRFKMSYQDIANKFGVSKGCITMIMTGRNWSHVK